MSELSIELSFKLDVDPDGMQAELVVVSADSNDTFLTAESAMKALRQANVHHGVLEEELANACEKFEEMEEGRRVIVAKATPPVHGKDGDVHFKVDVSGKASYNSTKDKSGRIDFKAATSVVSVKPKQILAVHTAPVPGTPGTTIFGGPLPPRSPKDFTLRAGQNVIYDENSHQYISTANGRPIYADGAISVLPVYEVAGDVDYSTGHIRFAGSVIINGSVQDDFNITAKDILIRGTVGACTLTAESNITVRGGINGRDKAMIRCGGELVAKYLNNVDVESMGDIMVMREIVHSTLLCNGRVRTGSLIGGLTVARKGCEVNFLGSDLGVTTRVEPGVDIAVRKIELAIAKVAEKLEAILKPVEIFFGNRAKYKALPEDKKEDFQKRYDAFCRLHAAHNKLATERTRLLSQSTQEPTKEVIIHKMLHQDSIVATELCMKNFTKPATGPLVIIEDIDRSTMSIMPFSTRTRVEEQPKK